LYSRRILPYYTDNQLGTFKLLDENDITLLSRNPYLCLDAPQLETQLIVKDEVQ